MRNAISAVVLIACAGGVLGAARTVHAGVQDRFWASAVDGVWNVPANWSPVGVPNNVPGPTRFNAFLRVGGAAYTVDLDVDVALDNLTIDAPLGEATLRLNGFDMNVSGDFAVSNGNTVRGTGTGELTIDGAAEYVAARFFNVPRIRHNGPVRFDSPGLGDTICDTDIEHAGLAEWTGAGDIALEGSSTWTTLAGGEFRIAGAGSIRSTMGTPRIENAGVIVKDAGSTSIIESVGVTNSAGGAVRIESGALTITGAGGSLRNDGTIDIEAGRTLEVVSGATLTNLAAGVLTGGVFDVAGTLRIDTGGGGIDTIAADVRLDGAGSAIQNQDTTDALASTSAVAATGRLALLGGRDLTTGGDFDNAGAVVVDALSEFAVPAGADLNGFLASGTRTLSGGNFEVRGTLRFDTGEAGVDVIDAGVVLDGDAATVVSTSGADALATARVVGDAGSLELRGGRDFTTAGTFTVAPDGDVVVGAGSVFEVPNVPGNRLTNFDAGVLADGNFDVRGTLRAPNLAVNTIGLVGNPSSVTLDGTESRFESFSGDALAALSTIETGSTLTLRNGRSLAVTGTLSVRGTLRIENAGPRGVGAPTTSVRVDGDYVHESGTLELLGGVLEVGGVYELRSGTLSGFGTVDLSITSATRGGDDDTLYAQGAIAPGTTASPIGALAIDGDLRLLDGSSVRVQLGAAGVSDSVAASGLVDLDGAARGGTSPRLEISTLGAGVVRLGDFYDVVFWGTREGEFAHISGLDLGAGLRLEPIYLADRLRLVAVPGPGGALLGAIAGAFVIRRRR